MDEQTKMKLTALGSFVIPFSLIILIFYGLYVLLR